MLVDELFVRAAACKENHGYGAACNAFEIFLGQNWSTAVSAATKKRATPSATCGNEVGPMWSFKSCDAQVHRKHDDQHMVEYHLHMTEHSLSVKVSLLKKAARRTKRSLGYEHFDGDWIVAWKSEDVYACRNHSLEEVAALADEAFAKMLTARSV